MPKGSNCPLVHEYKPNLKLGLYSCTNTDFIAILVYILYNVLLTCHLHIYNSNSVLNTPHL